MTTKTMTPAAKTFAAHLRRLGACEDAYRWARGKSGAVAWRTCKRGDWLLWLAARAEVRRQDLVLAACACARLALKHVPADEHRPRIAIETAERWARSDDGVTLGDVRAAADAADAAAAAVAAADVAPYAAYAAYAVADAAARKTTLAECADLVRERIPWSTVRNALAASTKEAA